MMRASGLCFLSLLIFALIGGLGLGGAPATVTQLAGSRRASGVVSSNEIGSWMWVPGGRYVGEVVVVLGGNGGEHLSRLLEEGFLVWQRNVGSEENGDFSQQKWDETVEKKIMMREAWGYLGYLGDSDPRKPTAEYVALVKSGRSAEECVRDLKTAVFCAEKRKNRVTPIHRHSRAPPTSSSPTSQAVERAIKSILNGKKLPTGATYAAEFVAPTSILKNESFYQNIEKSIPWRLTTTFDRFWAALFGGLDVARGLPVCDDPLDRAEHLRLPPQSRPQPQPQNLDGFIEWNDIGIWMYPTKPTGKPLVVIGGTRHNPTRELLKWGYTVWRRNLDCQRYLRDAWGVEDTTEAFHICTESWGYLAYLADDDKGKPVSELVVFHHGHLQSWHQPGELKFVLDDAISCAEKRPDRLTPLTKVDTMSVWTGWEQTGKSARWIHTWNTLFGDIRRIKGKRLQAWCCASFVIPSKLITSHPPSVYRRFLREKITSFTGRNKDPTGYFFEYTFHLIFGEPEEVDISGIPECPSFTYARDTQQGKSQGLLEAEKKWKAGGREQPRPSRVHG